MKSLLTLFGRQVMREILLHLREFRFCLNTCLFFFMMIVFVPLTMPPDPALLRSIAPGVVWIGMLLALMLSAERIFQQDYDDGVIEQWLVSGYAIEVLILGKMVVHWGLNILPMFLFSPVLALLFRFDVHETMLLLLSFICGTPTILALCTLASSCGLGLKQKGVLMALIILPLTIPVMILGSAAITATLHDMNPFGYLALLLALSIVTVSFLPFAIAQTLRMN